MEKKRLSRSRPTLLRLSVILIAVLIAGCDKSLEELLGAIEPVPESGLVADNELQFHLVFPTGWYERKVGTDPEWQREFVRPDQGAEVFVYAEREAEGTTWSINAFMRYMTDEANKLYTDFRVLDRRNLPSKETVGRLWHASGNNGGTPMHFYCAFYVRYNMAFAIFAMAPSATFPEVEAELESIIGSFELNTLRS